ncbi:protein-disulfide reductase DsbD family protein [Pokkaliibacter sp. CJK22405]|uniref:protein-disulfide reductase DsbD family protein n=1 Tax=Pokkaliibacter sp. CJK22405 TaxID=3384615 RepID=UPI003984A58C
MPHSDYRARPWQSLIRWPLALLCCLLLATTQPALAEVSAAQGQTPQSQALIQSSLIPESATPEAGKSVTLAIAMTPQQGWHGYWKQPGDAGIKPTFQWTLPEGVEAGEPEYPVPETLVTEGLMNHVYSQPYALLTQLTLADQLKPGTVLPVHLEMQYLVCSHEVCVPEKAQLDTTLTVGQGEADGRYTSQFDTWRRQLPKPLLASAVFTQQEHDEMTIKVPLPAGITLNHPHLFAAQSGVLVDAAPQHFERDQDTLIITTQASGPRQTAFDGVLALNENLGLAITLAPEAASAPVNNSLSPLTILLTLASAIAGGLLLNLMPCVFPILSLKAMSLARSGGNASHARAEALAYTLGVVLVCVALGGIILALRAGGTQIGWAFQLQSPAMIFVLFLLAGVIAFNFAGLFELGSISFGSGVTQQPGVTGAFATGALAAFVATPCSGPFMAAALGAALVFPTLLALLIFAGLGVGIALPFLLIGFIPAAQRRLPKPGPWMSTLRHCLSVPMFITALALLWVLGHQVSYNSLIGALGCALLLALGLWMTGLRQQKHKNSAWLPAAGAALLALALGFGLLRDKPVPAEATPEQMAFNAEQLKTLRAGDDPVFLYFTADWCVTCKVNEQVAIDTEATQQAFARAHVKVMRGDWTQGDTAITAFLQQHGRSGVPLYLWYSPGHTEPDVLPQLLAPNSLVERARL